MTDTAGTAPTSQAAGASVRLTEVTKAFPLRATWDQVGGGLPLGDRLSGTGLGARLDEADGKDIVLVTLPRPEHGAEAHFVAVVVAEDRLAGYFVLEHGWTTTDEPRTVLCKWNDEDHVNLGDGPPADETAFLSAVRSHISSEGNDELRL